jgi:hypothetical protein
VVAGGYSTALASRLSNLRHLLNNHLIVFDIESRSPRVIPSSGDLARSLPRGDPVAVLVEGYWAGGRAVVSRIRTLLVVIPLTSLVLVCFLIMVLATFAKAPRLASSQPSSDVDEEVQVGLPVVEGPDFFH